MAALLLGSVAIDAEPIYCLLNNCQLHGILHSYVGAAAFSLAVVSVLIYVGRKHLQKLSLQLGHAQDYSLKSIISGTLVGASSHVLLDSFMHFDVTPFWPSPENPFLRIVDSGTNYLITIVGFVAGAGLYFFRLSRLRRDERGQAYSCSDNGY
ncbi:MAG TPA: metal-dependent hydrolase [Nitrososphaera sp.]|jgi:membrane-bound metal-dependent hydrolase YbcI (DUF457 family)